MGVAAPQAAHAGAMDIELHWTDATRAPLDNLVISGHLERPVENIPPLQVAFVAVGGGRYRSTVVLPERGAWDLYVTAARGSDSFEAAERLIMPCGRHKSRCTPYRSRPCHIGGSGALRSL